MHERLVAIALVGCLLALALATNRGEAAGPPELIGGVPPGGGFSLVVWSGGDVDRLALAASSQGCILNSSWAVSPGGELVGYIPNAPNIVNAAFIARYPKLVLPANTGLILVCNPGAVASAPIGETALPLGVAVQVAAGVPATDEMSIRQGSAAAQDYLAASFGSGLLRAAHLNVHADDGGAPIGNTTACCYARVAQFHIHVGNPDWISTTEISALLGFDLKAQVAAHEYMHLWAGEVGCADFSVLPAWIVEGMAEYVSFEAMRRRGLVTLEQQAIYDRAQAIEVPLNIKLQHMEQWDVFHAYPGYGLASLGFQHLLATRSAVALHHFCVDIAAGATWSDAFTVHFGLAPAAFYASFEAQRPGLLP